MKMIIALTPDDKNDFVNAGCKNVVLTKYLVVNADIDTNYKDETKNIIMVSHSGWPENNHIESFKLIADKRINEEFIIICPLAYGDEEYIQKVVSEGKKYFGTKFHYFTDLMDIKDYQKLLKQVKVFIASSSNQTGLFNISSCLANGAKVYCKENLYNTMKHYGFNVFNTSELMSDSSDNWMNLPVEVKKYNKNVYFNNYKNIPGLIKQWNTVYDG